MWRAHADAARRSHDGLSSALGDLLPAALGVALSPIPIIATVLMLLSQRARQTRAGLDTSSSSDTTYWIKLVIGALFLLLAGRTWMKRPRAGQDVEPPTWTAMLDTVSPVVAAGLGAALSALNPKNLALAVSGARPRSVEPRQGPRRSARLTPDRDNRPPSGNTDDRQAPIPLPV